MAHHRTSAWTWVLIAGLLLFGGVYLVLIIASIIAPTFWVLLGILLRVVDRRTE